MNAKCGQGEIKQSVCDEFNAATKGNFSRLPERVKGHVKKRPGI